MNKQWNGPQDGLPPVGSTVLNRFDEKRRVVAHDGDVVVCATESGGYRGYDDEEQKQLKPIRTPEQIAAAAREKAIEEMWAIHWAADTAKDGIAALYDAGYRKQPTQDMTDWRNWKVGDLVECIHVPLRNAGHCTAGLTYRIDRFDSFDESSERLPIKLICNTGISIWCGAENFRWHSRPSA